MRKKNWAALLCSILILASIGLGVSIIYSDYYFSPVSGLQSFTVADVSRDIPSSGGGRRHAKRRRAVR